MFHLVYSSTALEPVCETALLARLPRYRAKNLRLAITGLLLYKQGEFMQVLEGEETDVRSLFATIQADPHHNRVQLLVSLDVPKRHFARWSMGFKNLDNIDAGTVPGYTPYPDFPAYHERSGWKGSIATSLLASFMHEY